MTATTPCTDTSDQMPIIILGGGLAGLTLGRCLGRRGIPSVIYEKSSRSTRRHGYGITLLPWAYEPLLKTLELDEVKFRRGMEIGWEPERKERFGIKMPGDGKDRMNSIRVNRKRLEDVLATGLDIRWDHKIETIGVDNGAEKQGLKLTFSNGEVLSPSNIVVDALGVHSKLRADLLPDVRLDVHPYVVYNGRRNIEPQVFTSIYAPAFKRSAVLVREPERRGDPRLEISLTDNAGSGQVSDAVSVSYVCSRPARTNDSIFNASRSKDAASTVNEGLFGEIETFISSQHDIDPPFQDCFAIKQMRNDRLLNWLMRSLLTTREDLDSLAQLGIVMLGDSVHAVPILGADGANLAIADAMRLSDMITEAVTSPQGKIAEFYADRYPVWETAVEESESNLAAMHQPAKGSASL